MITELATRRPLLDDALTEHERLQHAHAGTILFDEGEQPYGIYVLHSGKVDLLYRGRPGELRNLREGYSGEILGLGAVVSGRAHDYAARACSACELGFIDKDSFLGMLEENPATWLNVLRLLSHHVNSSYDLLRTAVVAH